MLSEGQVAPGLAGPRHDGTAWRLDGMKGHWVLLWWYPKGAGAGCASCMGTDRSRLAELRSIGIRVYGLTFDPPYINYDAAMKNELPFISVTRTDAETWDALRSQQSQWSVFPKRIAYLIDPQSNIAKVYSVGGHNDFLAEVINEMKCRVVMPKQKGLRRLLYLGH